MSVKVIHDKAVCAVGLEASLLLAQVAYWFKPSKTGKSKLRVKREGKLWIAKSHEAWQREVNLSPWGVRCALRTLVRDGYVERRKWFFSGKTVLHIHLTEKGRRLLITARASGEFLLTGQVNSSQPYTEELQTEELQVNSSEANASLILEEKKMTLTIKSKDGKTKVINPLEGKSVLDVLKEKAIVGKKHVPKSNTVDGLVATWVTVVPECFPKSKFISITVEQKGMFKHFLDKCPNGEAVLVLEYTIRNWGKFVFQAEKSYSAYKVPALPSIGHVLKYIGAAVNLYINRPSVKSSKEGAQGGLKATVAPNTPATPKNACNPPKNEDTASVLHAGKGKKTVEEVMADIAAAMEGDQDD